MEDGNMLESVGILDEIIDKFKEFQNRRVRINRLKIRDSIYRLSKDAYEYTKDFLDIKQDVLSPEEKGFVFGLYVVFWKEAGCQLDVGETPYADLYQDEQFKAICNKYHEKMPMFAGFNLSRANLSDMNMSYTMFLSVNLRDANFIDAQAAYSYFENCDLSGSIMYQRYDERNMYESHYKTNFNQCIFVKCNLRGLDMLHVGLHDATFMSCDVRSTILRGKDMSFTKFSICNNATKGIYPIALACAESERYVGLQNVDAPEVIAYWKSKYDAKIDIPPLLMRAVLEHNAKTPKTPSTRVHSDQITQDGTLSPGPLKRVKK